MSKNITPEDVQTSDAQPQSTRITRLKQALRHPRAVPVLTFATLLVLVGAVYIVASSTHSLPSTQHAKIVIVSYDHEKQIVPARSATVGSLIQRLNITLHEGDVVEPKITTKIDQDQFRINIYRAVPVQVVDQDGDAQTHTFSAATTPRSIAQQAGEKLYPEDIVSSDPVQDFVKSGAIGKQVVIDRAVPVNVNLYGTPVVLRTHATTVGQLIKEKNIEITANDKLNLPEDTPLNAATQVAVLRTGTKVETVNQEIATPVQTINDPNLAYGTSAVRQQGTPGQQTVTYQVALKNNVEVGRTVIQTVVTKQPVTQIQVVGSSLSGIKGDMALAGIAPGDYQYADYIIGRESGWCPTKAQGQYGGCPAYSGSVPSTGGYGLCQSTPGSKMASAGADWATNPVTQLKWCSNYAKRYGGWAGSYNHWLTSHNW